MHRVKLVVALVASLLALHPRAPAQALQEVQLLDAEGVEFDSLGASVSVSGDTVAVAATGLGVVKIFVRSGTHWELQAELSVPSGDAIGFGMATCLVGDTLVVGAPFELVAGQFWAGAGYVFQRTGTTWVPQGKLVAAAPQEYDRLGGAVALSGDTVLLGGSQVHGFNPPQSGPGLAYVFTRHGATWTQQAKLTGPGLVGSSAFGTSVALDGETALIGAPTADLPGPGLVGAAYVFTRAGATWSLQATLQGAEQTSSDVFGRGVALDGDTALVGAPGDTHGGILGAGSVSVFTRSGGLWTEQAKLIASDTFHGESFGTCVALDGEACVVGAPYDSHSGQSFAGAAYVFARTGGTWAEAAKLTGSDAWTLDSLGYSVSLSGDTAFAGAPFHDTGTDSSTGTAFGYRVLTTAFGSWADLGQALAGASGLPRLVGWGDLLDGADAHLTLTFGKAGGFATLVVGLSALQAPFKGGVLVPDADLIVPGLPIGSDTKLELSASWPAGIPSGLQAWYQIWVADPVGPQGLSASNAVRSTTP